MQRRCIMIFGVLLSAMLLIFAFSTVVFAAPGEGDGGGGGPVIPLRIDWSYPANGEKNVSVTPIIQCKYSHNVALDTVMRRNATLFLMSKLDGPFVDINVYAADSQLEFNKRQYIYIEPVKPLEYNTTYVVTAKEGIQAKNGMVTEINQSLQFTTCGRRMEFNSSNVSPMVQKEGGKVNGTVKPDSPAATDAGINTGKKEDLKDDEDNPGDAAFSEMPQGSPAVGGREDNRAGAISKAGFAPEDLNLALVICCAASFLLILSIVVSGYRTKRRK